MNPYKSQFFSFGAVGTIGFCINASIVHFLAAPIGPIKSQLLAFPCALTTTWILNRVFTFKKTKKKITRELFQYICANAIGGIVNNSLYFIIVSQSSIIFNMPTIAVAAGSIAGLIVNYTLSRKIVFSSNQTKK